MVGPFCGKLAYMTNEEAAAAYSREVAEKDAALKKAIAERKRKQEEARREATKKTPKIKEPVKSAWQKSVEELEAEGQTGLGSVEKRIFGTDRSDEGVGK